jgi:hypothetical protein
MGLFLASIIRNCRSSDLHAPENLEKIKFLSEWLINHSSPGYSGACWGYNFDWPNRGFFAPRGTPTIINTAFIGLAFLDMHRVLGDEGALSVARSACDFILKDLNVFRTGEGDICFSYTPLDERYIHNANLKGAQLLAEVYVNTHESNLADQALAATRYTLRRQGPEGSWFYGEAQNEHWIDNFHTGFVLVALKKIAANLDQDDFSIPIERGYRYWKENFFLTDGTPKYYNHHVYPIDVHCVAQAILTFLEFRDLDSDATEWAWRVALWGIENMQSPEGYFHYQIHTGYRIRIPFIRWSQAWMQRALTELLWAL